MNKLISHVLVKIDNKYLVIKRTQLKRGNENVYPLYWDIPGGMVEDNELPVDAAIREAKEEVNLDVIINRVIHEDSNLDNDTVYTRLVYEGEVVGNVNIILDSEEHNEYKLINNINDLEGERIVPYLEDILD